MPEEQWKQYLAWVAGYGSTQSRRTKRLDRQLTSAREAAPLYSWDRGQVVYRGGDYGRSSGAKNFIGATQKSSLSLPNMYEKLLNNGKRS